MMMTHILGMAITMEVTMIQVAMCMANTTAITTQGLRTTTTTHLTHKIITFMRWTIITTIIVSSTISIQITDATWTTLTWTLLEKT